MKVILVNLKRESLCDIYIGRPSIYGNPYLTVLEDRDAAVRKHKIYLRRHREIVEQLRQEIQKVAAIKTEDEVITLGCFCTPLLCHGQNYLEALRG